MLSFVVAAIPSLTPKECVSGLMNGLAAFNLRRFDLYEGWFDENSTVTLAQSDAYHGIDEIKEYTSLIFPSSPFISTNGLFRSDSSFVSVDAEKRSCVLMRTNHNRLQMSELAGNELFEAAVMLKLEWRFDDKKIGNIWVHCAPRPCSPRAPCIAGCAITPDVC